MTTHAANGKPLPNITAQRVLDEGARPLLVAAADAGLRQDACPSLKTFLRAAISHKLEAVKLAGRWLTSPAAVRRWIEAEQHRRDRYGSAAGIDPAAADTVLGAYGLARPHPDKSTPEHG